MSHNKPHISIVIPVFNEADSIESLHQELLDLCKQKNYNYEIIFVDDGSTDSTEKIIKQLTPVKAIFLRKNFGQTAAMDAGIKAARYEYIVTMDGDLQNDPADIPALLTYLEDHNLDVVSGWRKNRYDSIAKRVISRGANFLRYMIVKDGIHDSGCSLKVFRRTCFENITLYGEMHRFIPAILKIKGFKIGERVVNHRPRKAGQTKYNWKRTIKGAIDMISVWFWHKYAIRPLHLMGGMGLFLGGVGGLFGIKTLWLYFRGVNLSSTLEPLLTVFFSIAGLQLFICGLLADILIKIYYEKTTDVPYAFKEIFENNNP